MHISSTHTRHSSHQSRWPHMQSVDTIIERLNVAGVHTRPQKAVKKKRAGSPTRSVPHPVTQSMQRAAFLACLLTGDTVGCRQAAKRNESSARPGTGLSYRVHAPFRPAHSLATLKTLGAVTMGWAFGQQLFVSPMGSVHVCDRKRRCPRGMAKLEGGACAMVCRLSGCLIETETIATDAYRNAVLQATPDKAFSVAALPRFDRNPKPKSIVVPRCHMSSARIATTQLRVAASASIHAVTDTFEHDPHAWANRVAASAVGVIDKAREAVSKEMTSAIEGDLFEIVISDARQAANHAAKRAATRATRAAVRRNQPIALVYCALVSGRTAFALTSSSVERHSRATVLRQLQVIVREASELFRVASIHLAEFRNARVHLGAFGVAYAFIRARGMTRVGIHPVPWLARLLPTREVAVRILRGLVRNDAEASTARTPTNATTWAAASSPSPSPPPPSSLSSTPVSVTSTPRSAGSSPLSPGSLRTPWRPRLLPTNEAILMGTLVQLHNLGAMPVTLGRPPQSPGEPPRLRKKTSHDRGCGTISDGL